ncbi:SMI1/KNR4 family protein [Roseovarius sp. CAU 1744]|uniref:SMI1/KNR4 family protein n=1 Tax=Roseovarius sp. CAU 1744 TaxID=3140368 RepID=UPI00325BDC9B
MYDIEKLEAFWNVKVPNDLKTYWMNTETFEGFCSDNPESEYVRFCSAQDSLAEFSLETREFMPFGFLPLGTNGSGELIVFAADHGYGLLPSVHGGANDFHSIANSLKEFWEKSKNGSWFD